MKSQIILRTGWVGLLAALGALLSPGCKSRPLGPYVSPRVEGVVVASDTGQPLARAKVSRGREDDNRSRPMPKGGELLIRKAPVLTGEDGTFVLASERVLSIVRGAGWNEVRLTISHAGYFKLQTNYSLVSATNSVTGESLLDIGKVGLVPVR